MPALERHVFVCVNERPDGAERGCCASKGARAVRARLKQKVKNAGLKGRVRINNAGCLDHCEEGVTIVVYPEAVWYRGVTLEDVDELFDRHIVAGRPVRRLLLTSGEDEA